MGPPGSYLQHSVVFFSGWVYIKHIDHINCLVFGSLFVLNTMQRDHVPSSSSFLTQTMRSLAMDISAPRARYFPALDETCDVFIIRI
jgi:hypothetical protein